MNTLTAEPGVRGTASLVTPRVALYARISEDTAGEAAGVRRQLDACRTLALARGWTIVEECQDNDISALRGKARPGYQRVMDLVRTGAVDYVVVWQTSRLLRNRRERADAIGLLGSQGAGIITVKGQDLDLSNAYGRGMAGILGEFDTMESEVKSERVAAAAADRARSGRPNGALGYGWSRLPASIGSATHVENPEQTAIVREVTQRLLSGESLLGVTADLNARGVTAPNSPRWGKTSVKKLALRPANAGLRIHHRGRPTETTYNGTWPPLVTRAEWERVTALLSDPGRRTNGVARPGARKHLLTWGIGSCDVCEGFLRVGIKGNSRHGSKKPLYLCADKGCVGRDQANVDNLVRAVVVERLSRDDALDWLRGDDDEAQRLAARAQELRDRLDRAADQYADGAIDARQLERITARLRPQVEAADRASGAATVSLDLDVLRSLAGPAATSAWDALPVASRRAVLETLGLRVRVSRVQRRGPGFDPGSVKLEWRSHG